MPAKARELEKVPKSLVLKKLGKKAVMHAGNILIEEQLLFPFMVKLKLVAGYFKKFSSK
jgi:hypothetical protein